MMAKIILKELIKAVYFLHLQILRNKSSPFFPIYLAVSI